MVGGFEIEDALLQMWDAGKEKPTQEIKHLTFSLDKFSPTAGSKNKFQAIRCGHGTRKTKCSC